MHLVFTLYVMLVRPCVLIDYLVSIGNVSFNFLVVTCICESQIK